MDEFNHLIITLIKKKKKKNTNEIDEKHLTHSSSKEDLVLEVGFKPN
jgi:hypothetical protein